MIIIEDTRQKVGYHTTKHNSFAEMGIRVERCEMAYGDYMFPPAIAVDTKRDIEEVSGNLITGDHARFRNECILARDAGSHLYILIENENGITSIDDLPKWEHKFAWKFRKENKRVPTGEHLMKTMNTMHEKYGVTFMFCSPENSADMIIRILNREFEDGK